MHWTLCPSRYYENFVLYRSILRRFRMIKNPEKVTNIIFSNKRKMINKNIKKIFKKKEKLKKIKNLDLKKRPSEISPDVYYKLTELYESF